MAGRPQQRCEQEMVRAWTREQGMAQESFRR